MKPILATLLICWTSLSVAQQPIIVTPEWLMQHKNDPGLVILQPNFLIYDYNHEHIEGARFLWPGWLSPDTPEGNMNLPDPKQAAEVLERLGVSNDSHVVLCHSRNEVSPTARMLLVLEHLGMKGRVSYLNGGLDAWKKAGYPVTTAAPSFKPGKFKVNITPLIVDRDYVLKRINTEKADIIDARAKRFYDGDPVGYPRDGHIAGAKNIPFMDLVNDTNHIKPADELQSHFTPVVPDRSHELVTYCFIGQTASVVYLAGRILGYDIKLYDGSMQEWSRIDELPMEKTNKEN